MIRRIMLIICALLTAVTITGCASKRQFYSDYIPDQKVDEDIIVTPEFQEYDKNDESISVLVTNNSDEDFVVGSKFFLQKKEDGVWRNISVTGAFTLLAYSYPASSKDTRYIAVLKDHVLQPLPDGTYRIALSDAPFTEDTNYKNGRLAFSSEFTVK